MIHLHTDQPVSTRARSVEVPTWSEVVRSRSRSRRKMAVMKVVACVKVCGQQEWMEKKEWELFDEEVEEVER